MVYIWPWYLFLSALKIFFLIIIQCYMYVNVLFTLLYVHTEDHCSFKKKKKMLCWQWLINCYVSMVFSPHQWCTGLVCLTLAIDHWFGPWSGQTKDNKIIFATSILILQHYINYGAKTGWLGVRVCGLLFQWASPRKIQLPEGLLVKFWTMMKSFILEV